MKYPHVFVAGTFDGLHKGHRFFLSKAFSVGEKVTIGLTSDQFVKKNKTKYEQRRKILEHWLKQHRWNAKIIPINDPYEPAASFPKSVVLLVTQDNKHRGEEINSIRKKRRLPAFTLIEIPLVNAEDKRPISSTRVRKGEIDNEGRLTLPDNLRPQLQQPMGLVLHGDMIATSLSKHRRDKIITVGDVATKTLLDAGITPSLMIIDNKVERKPYEGLKKYRRLLEKSKKVTSGPGYISREAINAIKQHARIIEVDGEEDLLALPTIAYAPLGSIVYYGQPPIAAWACGPILEGLVEVEVTDESRKNAQELLEQFL